MGTKAMINKTGKKIIVDNVSPKIVDIAVNKPPTTHKGAAIR
jgi:hypothetical protein